MNTNSFDMNNVSVPAHDFLSALHKDPAAFIILAVLIVLGYAMQQWPIWPDSWNKGIPWVLMLLGIVMALAWLPVNLFPATQTNARSLIGAIGLLFGVIAMIVHMTAMQWAIGKLNAKFPSKPTTPMEDIGKP